MSDIDPEIRKLAEDYVASSGNKRGAAAVRMMLDKGFVTTDDLNNLGYSHPPRAIGDVRDAGIPVVTQRTISERTPNRRIAIYRLGTIKSVVAGRISGRSALPKAFKVALIAKYGSRDCITGAVLPATVLQIDHRVPYRIAGDAGLTSQDVAAYMLLDASSQRAKSWSCEACENFTTRLDAAICRTCYWASPESYEHIGMKPTRRTDVVWQDEEVADYDRLISKARLKGLTAAQYLKQLAKRP